jgi:hypothetical protein
LTRDARPDFFRAAFFDMIYARCGFGQVSSQSAGVKVSRTSQDFPVPPLNKLSLHAPRWSPTICAQRQGEFQGRRLTSWPGLRDDLVNAGATWVNEPLVHDGNLVTSRGPQDLKPFVAAITRLFARAERELEQEFPSSRETKSAPPPDEPPHLVLDVMRWMPKPSVRTILRLAIAAIAVSFYRRRHP